MFLFGSLYSGHRSHQRPGFTSGQNLPPPSPRGSLNISVLKWLSITLSQILRALKYKAQKIKGMQQTSKKHRQFKKRKLNSTRV